MRAKGGGLPRPAVAGVLLSGLVLLTGCASMPSSGEVHKVGGEKHADTDPQVRVFGVKPQGGETPRDIVFGFLEATTSDEADYATAKLYMTKDQGRRWKPESGITVLAGGPSLSPEPVAAADGKDGDSTQITVTGAKVARVDDRHAYRAEDGTFSSGIRLTKEDGEWRIAGVADGLVLSEADFQRFYRSVDTFYFAAPGSPKDAAAGRDALVADPIYLRKRINALSNAVNALLAGPTDWLKPVVRSEFPPGIKAEAVELDDSQRVTVKLKGLPARADADCERMAAQLIQTIQGMSSTPVPSVELQGPSGRILCTLRRDDARDYAPDKLVGDSDDQYFIDAEHHLVSLTADGTQPVAVAGPLGTGTFKVGSAAVRRDEQYAAALSEDAANLYVTELDGDAQLGPSVLRSRAADPKKRLTTPSWDGYGDLWIADRDPAKPQLLMLPDGAGQPVPVDVPDLGDGRIESLRVAADGVRIALLVRDGDHNTLQLGRIERTATAAGQKITVAELRSVAPQLEDVIAASWAGFSRLVVVGREAGGVPQIQYVDADGSGTSSSSLPGISGVVSVAASERQDAPLLAELDGGVFRLAPDSNWKEVAPKAGSPVYPG